MIDEKKLIDTLRPYYDKVLHQNISDDEKLAKHDMLSDVMVVIKEQNKIGDWILCSERLPEERQDVLVFDNYNNMYIASRVFKTFFDDEMNYINAIAWQPLPKAYHG